MTALSDSQGVESALRSIIKKLAVAFILLYLLLIPINSAGEIFALFSDTLEDQLTSLTPIGVKLLKDVIGLFIILLFFFKFICLGVNRVALSLFIAITGFSICSVFATLYSAGPDLIFGLRWSLFALLSVAAFELARDINTSLTFRVLIAIFFLHFFIQLIQFFYGITWYGVIGGLSIRNPGLFLIPNTAGMFSAFILIFCLEHAKRGWRRFCLLAVTLISIALTTSGAGLGFAFIAILIHLLSRRRYLYFSATLFLLAVFAVNIDQIIMRDGFTELSGGGRFNIFINSTSDSSIIADSYGSATNTAVLMGSGFIADSTITSILVNLGYAPLVASIIIFSFFAFRAVAHKNTAALSTLMLLFTFSLVTILPEAFPAPLLIGLFLGKSSPFHQRSILSTATAGRSR